MESMLQSLMDFLQSIFGEGVDLAAVASGAGLFGGGASAVAGWMVSGAILRFVIRTVLTAVLTGGGFLFLLHYLGFQIIPPDDLQERIPFGQSYDAPGVQEQARLEEREENGKRTYYVRSPFHKR